MCSTFPLQIVLKRAFVGDIDIYFPLLATALKFNDSEERIIPQFSFVIGMAYQSKRKKEKEKKTKIDKK